jgi:gliding motility-associated-like protein
MTQLKIVNDVTNCESSYIKTGTITGSSSPNITNVFFINPLSCGGTGTIKIAVLNGTNGTYTIDYDSNGTTDNTGALVNDTITLSGLLAGTIITNLTIADESTGCKATGNYPGSIKDPSPLSISNIQATSPAKCGDLGSMLITVTGAPDGHNFNIDFNSDQTIDRVRAISGGIIQVNDLTADTISGLTITDLTGNCSVSSTQSFVIQNPAKPTVTLSSSGALCSNAPQQPLNGGLPAGGRYTIDGNPATGINPASLGAGNHTVQYEYTDANNCADSASSAFVVNPLPAVSIAGEQNVCPQSQNIPYAANYNNAFQYTWNVTGGTYSPGDSATRILVNWGSNTSGTVQLSVVNTASHCADTSSISVNLADTESPVITHCLNDYHITASMDENGTYYIFSKADTACIPKATDRCSQNLKFTLSANGSADFNVSELNGYRLNKADQNTIRWTVTDNSGHSSECVVNLVLELAKTAPTAFSPNGDLHNDAWEIDFLVDYPESIVQVYNRWGMLVYESKKGYPVPWDGKSHGRLVPLDTYYYIINPGKNEKIIKGFVTVMY